MLRNLIGNYVFTFLNSKLDQGHHELVYGLSSYWGSSKGFGKFYAFYDAAWEIQKRLIEEFRYQECHSCYWAIERPSNHPYCAWLLEGKTEHEDDSM